MIFAQGQKLNVHSSTEEELVGVDATIQSIMWEKTSLKPKAMR